MGKITGPSPLGGYHISAGYYILQVVAGLLGALCTALVGIAMTLAYKRAKDLA